MAEEHLSAHGEKGQRKDAPKPELGKMHREYGPEVSSNKKPQHQQQRHAQVGVASALVLHECEQPHRQQ